MGLPHIPLGGKHSQQVHDRFRISNDPIGAFVGARCELDSGAYVAKDVLRGAFKEFCEQHDLSARMDEWFLRNLYERWPQLREIRPREDDGQRRRVITGIGVNP
jgi:hypothetical protein